MATIDLGKIKFVFRGTYAGGTAYVPDDVVTFTDGSVTSSYICVTATTGNNPSSGGTAHSSWNFLAKGASSSPTTTQGDIIVRGASADGRLAIGAAGKVLKVNSGANGLEYGDLPGVTLGSPVSVGTGTNKAISIDSTNLYKIEIVFHDVSQNGSANWGFQLGYSNGTFATSGYKCAAGYFSNASYANHTFRTNDFSWTGLAGGSYLISGRAEFTRYDGNQWMGRGHAFQNNASDGSQYFFNGYKDLGNVLTDIRLVASSNLSTNFDNGYYKLILHSS